MKEKIKIFIEVVKKRKELFDYVFLYGLFGFGKIILVNIIVNEMGVDIKVIFGFVIERVGDFVVIFINIGENNILFIDEIYRLNRIIEEVLYFVMEDKKVDIVIGKGLFVKIIRLILLFFIFIGVIIRVGFLLLLLRDRFGIIERFDYYIVEELS